MIQDIRQWDQRAVMMAIGLAGALAIAGAAVISTGGAAQGTLTVEVAETGSRFVPDPSLADADGNGVRGTYFITEGYIYEPGTLTCTEGACDGVLYDDEGNASPEFPDALIGTWTCYGTHVADGATTTTGPIVVTTQLFDLGAGEGADTIMTNGLEWIDVDLPISRAIIGGTGEYAGASGVQTQTLLGFNNAELVIDEVPLFGLNWTVDLPVG